MKTFKFSGQQRKQKIKRLSQKQLKQIIGGELIDRGGGEGGYPDLS